MKITFEKLYNKKLDNRKDYTAFKPISSVIIKGSDATEKFDIEVDRPYYEMVEKMLDHQMHLFAKMHWINIRSIYITNNDCIPYVQISFAETGKVRMKVCQRSFDIGKHQHNDIMFFVDYANKLASMANSDGDLQMAVTKEVGEFKPIEEVEIDWSCEFPHAFEALSSMTLVI